MSDMVQKSGSGKTGNEPVGLSEKPEIDDPVADLTEWSPACSGGANFKTHGLESAGPNRLEFRSSAMNWLFGCTFFFMGSLAFGIVCYAAVTKGIQGQWMSFTFMGGFGLIFALVGVALFLGARRCIVFDDELGMYWTGQSPGREADGARGDNWVLLREIHAVQVISQHFRGSRDSAPYHSHEINLVLHDGVRYNVVDHGSHEKAVEDATTLAEFLDVPLWDASVER